jgi:hypothetical protein
MSAEAPTLPQVQGYTRLRSFRYERKFLVEDLAPRQVESLIRLHPAIFYAPYPPRHVNNLYLDTPDMENYYDNVYGAAQRRKVRLRWYGTLLGKIDSPMLEIKVKEGLVGIKHSYPLADFHLEPGFSDRSLQQVFAPSGLPENVWYDMKSLNLVLLNRYYRRYYASRNGRYRLTLDTNLEYHQANHLLGNTFIHKQVNHGQMVLELKYEAEHEPGADRVASYFPFRVTRFSKYVQGVERVYF